MQEYLKESEMHQVSILSWTETKRIEKRTAKMVSLFEKKGVHFRVMTDMQWIDNDSMENRERSNELLKYHFLNCEAGKTCKWTAFGKLWTYPFLPISQCGSVHLGERLCRAVKKQYR